MSKRKIDIEIGAKTRMQKGLADAKAQLKAFGDSAKRIGAFFAKTFLAAGAAVAGFAAKALSAYAKQEKAERALAASIESYGENAAEAMPKLRALAGAIQDQTGVADEATLQNMALLRSLGVETGELDAAAKGVIALGRAGMSSEAAARALAAAQEGNYSALQRYIPALRTATTETEKANALNEFLTRNYQAQRDELNTVSGQWNLLKGRVGDVWEELGRAIAQNDLVTDALQRAGDAVKAFGDRIREWVDSGGMERVRSIVEIAIENIRQQFRMASNTVHVTFAAIGDGAETAFTYLRGVLNSIWVFWSTQFKSMGDVAVAAFNMIRRPSRETFRALGDAVKNHVSVAVEAYKQYGRALAGENEIVSRRTEEALEARQAMHDQHASNLEKIAQRQADRANKIAEDQAKAEVEQIKFVRDAAIDAEDARIAAAEERAAKLKETQDELTRNLEALEKEQADHVADQERKKTQARRDALDEAQKLARRRVADVIAEAEREKQLAAEVAREDERMQRLQDNVRRGVRLGRRQAEQLDAWERIQEAKEAEKQMLRDAKEKAEQERQAKVDAENKRLEDIKRIREELADVQREKADNEIEIAKNVADIEHDISTNRVDRFIEASEKRKSLEKQNVSDVIESMQDVADARDRLFPEAISGAVGDNISGAISAAEAFKNQQLEKMQNIIDAIEEQTETLDQLLRLG